MKDTTPREFALAAPSRANALAGEFVEHNYELPEGSVIDTGFQDGEVWADAGSAMFRIAYLDELLENDTFVSFVYESDEFLLFATNGDGK